LLWPCECVSSHEPTIQWGERHGVRAARTSTQTRGAGTPKLYDYIYFTVSFNLHQHSTVMNDEFAPATYPTPNPAREVNPENIFVQIFDTVVDVLLKLPSFIYNLPWDLKGFPVKEKLAPLLEQLDSAASKPQVNRSRPRLIFPPCQPS
jgi:hypothetical protein